MSQARSPREGRVAYWGSPQPADFKRSSGPLVEGRGSGLEGFEGQKSDQRGDHGRETRPVDEVFHQESSWEPMGGGLQLMLRVFGCHG